MLTPEYYTVTMNNDSYVTRIQSWRWMLRNLRASDPPYRLIPEDHPKDPMAVRVESRGKVVGYLPANDPQDIRRKVWEWVGKNRLAIMRMAEDTTTPEQLRLGGL